MLSCFVSCFDMETEISRVFDYGALCAGKFKDEAIFWLFS